VPLKVRGGPGTQYPILAQAPDSTALRALESEETVRRKVGQQGEWLNVQTSEGVTGYVAAWYIRLQTAPAVAAVAFGLPVERAAPVEERKLVQADDLQRIRGIGPKTEEALQSAGVGIFEQLAARVPEQLKALLQEKGIQARNVASWPDQARLIIEGKWEELEALQKKMSK
jgi:predicted flap endonuclease-1-like 5' DNA nuclease